MSYLRELTPIDRLVRERFHSEDELLRAMQQDIDTSGKPSMNIGPEQGRVLQLLIAASGACKLLEVGTFFGYSAVWMGRALPAGGRLICLEISVEHADKARYYLAQAGLDDRVEVRQGPAADLLPDLMEEAPFDLVFLDADRANYPAYLPWIERLLRPGGILVVDNAYLQGRLARPELADDATYGPSYRGMQGLLTHLASDEHWLSTVMPYADGLAVAVKRR